MTRRAMMRLLNRRNYHIKLNRVLTVTSGLLGGMMVSSNVGAQVIPDQTLPRGEQSQVTGNTAVQIDGGAQRGTNLFHSFSQFSIPTGHSAFFNNAGNIQTIFSRVTGGSISTIDGLIRSNGTADLFLLNPNGILFGSNARLEIGGSFLASTANDIVFADRTQFSAKDPQTIPLLTISTPIGLQVGQNSGSIRVQGSGYELTKPTIVAASGVADDTSAGVQRGGRVTGLQVRPGKTLALVGNKVELSNGTLQAEQGRLELGSVAGGRIDLSPAPAGFALSYEPATQVADVQFVQRSLLDASGGGTIQIRGDRVSFIDGALALIQNQGAQQGGSIHLNAATLELSRINPELRFVGSLRTEAIGQLPAADITVSAQRVQILEGAAITSSAYSSGRSGNIVTAATNEVQVIGFAPSNIRQNSLIQSIATGTSATGNITINTQKLALIQGGAVTTSVRTNRGGDLTVNATDVELSGLAPGSLSNITVRATRSGRSGDLTINTGKLIIQDGGTVGSFANRAGSGGNTTINASDSVEISGAVELRAFAGLFRSQVTTAAEAVGPPVGVILPTGTSGNLTINTGKLRVADQARVRVGHEGTGDAGQLRIAADVIVLNRAGQIEAATVSGQGGDINLQVRDALLLRRNSQITTSAGGSGSGGNINIASASIAAISGENSDILANSVNARGGNVIINANGVFGIRFRDQSTLNSDITATGANSALNGTVQLNVERTDFEREFVQLPTDLIDTAGLIAQGCRAVQGSSFVVTGRGGLPPTPSQAVSNDPLWRDTRDQLILSQTSIAPLKLPRNSEKSVTPPEIVEATEWTIDPRGTVILTATNPAVRSEQSLTQAVNCDGR